MRNIIGIRTNNSIDQRIRIIIGLMTSNKMDLVKVTKWQLVDERYDRERRIY